jgi:cell wall-associated NlpC family hydrolase
MTALPVTKHRVLAGKQANQVKADLARLKSAVEGAKQLVPGQSGKAVESLQRLMAGLNLYSGKPTGTYDAATMAAVAKLEARAGVATPDGIVDGAEVANLKKSQLFVKDGFHSFAVKGQTGSDIRRMEQQLTALGYKTGKVDGFYDADTARAVRKFRLAEKGVPNLTGNYAGTLVKKALNQNVKELEHDLKVLGAKVGKVDSFFSAQTEKAVRNFQRKHDLPVTGIANERTRNAVDRLADKKDAGGVKKFLDVALAQRGKPYVWGAEGPNSFDCSGLIHYALNKAGVKVPRLTADGYMDMFRNSRVSRDNLKPGDLLFFGDSPGHASHIEVYLGNGKSMGTDNPSEGARVESVNWSWLIGASRVPGLQK